MFAAWKFVWKYASIVLTQSNITSNPTHRSIILCGRVVITSEGVLLMSGCWQCAENSWSVHTLISGGLVVCSWSLCVMCDVRVKLFHTTATCVTAKIITLSSGLLHPISRACLCFQDCLTQWWRMRIVHCIYANTIYIWLALFGKSNFCLQIFVINGSFRACLCFCLSHSWNSLSKWKALG